TGLRLVGSNYNYFFEIFFGIFEGPDAGGRYTIIISNQNDRLVALFRFSFCHKMRKSKAKNIPLHPVKKIDMPGQLKEVRTRIKSVQNTQQITKAMKMVSAAKLRNAQEGIQQMRPYAKKLQEVLSNIVSSSDGEMGLSLAVERPAENILLIVITSDRGL